MSEDRYISDAPARVAAWVEARIGSQPPITDLFEVAGLEADSNLLAPIWRLTDAIVDRLIACDATAVTKLDFAVFHSVSTSRPLDRLLGAVVDAGLYPRRVVAAGREPGVAGTVLLVQCRRGRPSDLDALGALIRTAELSQLLRDPGRPSPRLASDVPHVLSQLGDLSGGFQVDARWADEEELLRRASPQIVLTDEPGAPPIRAAVEAGAHVVGAHSLVAEAGAVTGWDRVVAADVPRPVEPVAWIVGTAEDAEGLERLQAVAARWPAFVTRIRVHWVGEEPRPSLTHTPSGKARVDIVTGPPIGTWPRPTPDLVIVAPGCAMGDAPDLADMAEELRARGLDAVTSAEAADGWWVVRTAALAETERARVGVDLDLADTLLAQGATAATWGGEPSP